MIAQSELLELIARGENSGVEFKKDAIAPQDLAKELVAFANFEGGIVLLGVEDEGVVSGIVREGIEEWVLNVCRDKIRPPLVPYFEEIRNFEQGKSIALVQVTKGFDVHALWHNNANRYFIRVGSQSCDASHEELARLFQQKGRIQAELQPVSGTSLADLDIRRLRNYFGQIRQQDVPDDVDSEAWQRLLKNTKIMIEDSLTVGGMLLFGPEADRFLPYSGIDSVAYGGSEKDHDAQERIKLRGAMSPLFDAAGRVVENGLVEQAVDFVRRNTRVVLKKEGGRRIEQPAYPIEVLRESVVNALIHRDYLLTNTDIELSVYADRLELVSPGRLPNGVTPDQMRVGVRAVRNEFLKDVMRDYRYLEHMGMGVPRRIIRGMREHNGSEPDLIESGERFTIRLYPLLRGKIDS